MNGEVLLSKGSYKLGSEVKLKYGFNSPNSELPSLVNKDVTAGRKCAWKGFKDGMTISGSFLAYFSFIQGWRTKPNFFKKFPNIINILLIFFGIGTGIESIDDNTKECIK